MAETSGLFESWYNQVTTALTEGGQAELVTQQFAQLLTDEQRVDFVLKLPCVHNIIQIANHTSSKTTVQAQTYRNLGNKAFQSQDFHHAVQLYNDSVCCAPGCGSDNSGTDRALAFANRSAALFHLKYFTQCLVDIKEAFDCGYPPELQYKLFDRRGKCFVNLGRLCEARNDFDNALKHLVYLDEAKRKKLEQDLKKNLAILESREAGKDTVKDEKQTQQVPASPCLGRAVNPVYSSLSSACDVVYTAGQGRYLVAKRTIEPGQVVLVEEPYASILLLENSVTHCHHCYVRLLVAYPCDRCTTVRYCSSQCCHAAWHKYHAKECDILPLVRDSGVGKFGLLALRAVTISPLDFFLDFQQSVESRHEVSAETAGCNRDGLYVPHDYNTMYRLVTHAKDRMARDLFLRSIKAVFLLKCLEKADYFDITDLARNVSHCEEAAYIGGLLLSHLQSFPCNAHEISELELDPTSVATSVPMEVGAGIYASLSLFNHSCDPGVNRNFYGDTCVVRAIKVISEGEEISDNYGAVYAVHTKAERQQKLTPQYFFECQCQPCSQDWPLYADIEDQKMAFKCSQCGRELAVTEGSDRCVCVHCGQQESVQAKAIVVRKVETQFTAAMEKLLTCDVKKALPILLRCLQTLDTHVCRPWKSFNNCQEAVKQCFSMMGNCHVTL